ncbi:hypothetical protein C2W64_04530 [Brevibacillus laterosporus]|nr:hypothetical protein C2W64_04530 [Brevibacillus laterosporus]
MGTRVHYPEEAKWQVVKMKQAGVTNKEILEQVGIKDKKQIKTWMKWYRNRETYRFSQPVGKQYKYGKSGCYWLPQWHKTSLGFLQMP